MIRWRRPHKITLPGGYHVRVVYKTSRQIGSNDYLGYWETEKQRIVINIDAPLWSQVETFGHELQHAVTDYRHWLEQSICAVMQREAGETAMRLAEDLEELERD